MLIFLIGMPGSGKTTLGAELALELGFGFIDLDSAIEETESQAIPEIFRQKGEAYFREVEAAQLRRLSGADNAVVATGGGTPCFLQNMDWMIAHGLTVFLDVPVQVLEERLWHDRGRPLLSDPEKPLGQKLSETLWARKRYYGKAAVKLSAAAPKAKELAQLVRETLKRS